MALVTIELRKVLALEDFELFDFTYKCDDAAWKAELESKIESYFYFEEIGQETIDRWKQRFTNKMQLIMPYYNAMYNATLLNNDPAKISTLTEVLAQTSDSVNTGDISNDVKYTEFPQHTNITEDVLTNRSLNDSLSSIENTNTLDYTKTISGIAGRPYSELVKLHRDSLVNVTMKVIQELKSLFILVY